MSAIDQRNILKVCCCIDGQIPYTFIVLLFLCELFISLLLVTRHISHALIIRFLVKKRMIVQIFSGLLRFTNVFLGRIEH